MTTTENNPEKVTATDVRERVEAIQRMVDQCDLSGAQDELNKLALDTLFTIAKAPTIADKGELKRLAALALEAFPSNTRQT